MQRKWVLLRFAVLLLAISFSLFGLFVLTEAIKAFFFSTAEYHFGSESMVGVGGWAYRSRFNYLASALLLAVPALAGAGSLSYGAFKNHKGALFLGLMVLPIMAIELWLLLHAN